MCQKGNTEQLIMEGFRMAFGGHLSAQNRWVKLAELMPWEHIEPFLEKWTRKCFVNCKFRCISKSNI